MRKPIRWAEWLGRDECPYARRWVLDLGLSSIRVHHFLRSDDPRFLHDHPWWFLSLVIKGSYWDVSAEGRVLRRPGTLAFRPSSYAHYVDPLPGGVWTVILTGKQKRTWGFWVNGKFKKARRYFFDYGHPPCEVSA